MKQVLLRTNLRALILIAGLFLSMTYKAEAQCSTANVNWDNLDYLVTSGNYATYVTTAMSQTQAFALGVNRVSIFYPSTITTSGENTSHTGEAGSYGTGADVQYNGNGSITFTFDSEVSTFQFSLFDMDNSQRVNVTATNALGFPVVITMTKPATGTVTITGSGTTNAQGQAAGGGLANNVVTGTVNVQISGPVKVVTVTLAGTAGDFWLSDFAACVTGSFPVDYFVASQPFTNQPTYVMGTSDTNTVSMINVNTGQAKMIFQDATSPKFINGLGYDHLQHDLYYVVDFTSTPSTNKSIKRYDFDSESTSVLISDVTTLGIPTFSRGVESAGCSFYDNDLYFGIEGNASGNSSGRETIIWRIEFDVAGGTPIKACQVYATPSDNGSGVVMHDWNDFTIADGVLVDFAGPSNSSARRFTHYDLQTQSILNDYYSGSLVPRQAGITWDDTRYWLYDSIAVYNMNGTIGARTKITGANGLDWTGFCGDATGFRPKSDFGDAPATYDPVALSPALHEKDTSLHLGATWDQEFNKISSIMATADGADEDAIGTVNVLDTASTTYISSVQVYNNTGANATLIGWLDIDGNGLFDASEGRLLTIPHGGPVLQTVTLAWVGINTSIGLGQMTYLRIRLARQSSGMTTSNATGYYDNGEVEDYPVFVETVLPVDLLSFQAIAVDDNTVKIEWSTDNESGINNYEVQRSIDAVNWQNLANIPARNMPGVQDYSVNDINPFKGKSFYRLRLVDNNQQTHKYSDVRTVHIGSTDFITIGIAPNPVRESLNLQLSSAKKIIAGIRVLDIQGKVILISETELVPGINNLSFPEAAKWEAGIYYVLINAGPEFMAKKFLIVK
jgi:hypothetical protein